MISAQLCSYVGRVCAVTTPHGVFYGEFVRLSSVFFAVRAPFAPARAGKILGANDIVEIRCSRS